MADLTGYSDEELREIAGTPAPAATVSSLSDEELMKLAGVKSTPVSVTPPQPKEDVFPGTPSPAKVAGAALGGMAAMPIKGLSEVFKEISESPDLPGKLARILHFKDVSQVMGWVASLPERIVTHPAEKKALELMGLPFQTAGEGWRLIGEATGIPYAGPILGTAGELAAMGVAPGKVKARIREARTLRTLKTEAAAAQAENLATRRAQLGATERPLSTLAATERRVQGEGKVTAQVEREIATARRRESVREALNRYNEFEQRMGEREVTKFGEGEPFPEVTTEPRSLELNADRAREIALRQEMDAKGGLVEGFMPGEEPVVGTPRPVVSREGGNVVTPEGYLIREGTGRGMGPRERVIYDAQGRPIPQGIEALDQWLERPGAPRPGGEVPPEPGVPSPFTGEAARLDRLIQETHDAGGKLDPGFVKNIKTDYPNLYGKWGSVLEPEKARSEAAITVNNKRLEEIGGKSDSGTVPPQVIVGGGGLKKGLTQAVYDPSTGKVGTGTGHLGAMEALGGYKEGMVDGWVDKSGKFYPDTEARTKFPTLFKEEKPIAKAPAPKGVTADKYGPIIEKYDKVPIDKLTPEQRQEYIGALRARQADMAAKESTGLSKTEQKVLKTTKSLSKKVPPRDEIVSTTTPKTEQPQPQPTVVEEVGKKGKTTVPKTGEGIPGPTTNTPIPDSVRIPAVQLEDGTKLAGVGAKTYEEVATRKGYGASLIRKVGELDANGEWKLNPFKALKSEKGAATIPGDIIGAVDSAYKAGKEAAVAGKGGMAKVVEAARKGWDLVNREVITSAGRTIAKETAAGKEMIDGPKGVEPTFRAGERKGGDYAYKYTIATKKLTTQQKADVAKILDGQASARLFGPKVQKAAMKVRTILDRVAKEAGQAGLTVLHNKVQKWKVTGTKGKWNLVDEHGYVIESGSNKAKLETLRQSYLKAPFHARENYFPHMVKRETIEKRMDEAVNHLIKTGQVERADALTGRVLSRAEQEAIARSKVTIFMRRNSERRFGNLQISREMELPEWAYEHNPDIVLPTYFAKSGMRIEQAKNWGVKDENLYTLADKIGEQGGDMAFTRGLLDRMLFKDTPYAIYDSFTKFATGWQVVSKMGLSAISQTSQQLNSLYRGNMRSFLKAERDVFRNPEAAREGSIRAGSGLRGVAQKALEELTGTSGMPVDVYLRRVGFTAQDLRSRVVAYLTGRYYAEFLSDALKQNPTSAFAKRRLEGLDINPDQVAKQGFKLTEDQLLRAGQKFEIDTNFRNRVMDLPPFMTTRWGRVATQFSSFMYQQTKLLRDHVIKEAGHGNFMPLVWALTVGQVSGEIINQIRGAITGRKQSPNVLRRMVENYAAAGILGMFERAWSTTRYGEVPYGPSLGTAKRITDTIQNVASGNIRGAALTATKEIPIVGQALSHRAQEVTESKAQTTKRKNEERYWKQHPWSLRGLTPLGPPKQSVRQALSLNSSLGSVGGID